MKTQSPMARMAMRAFLLAIAAGTTACNPRITVDLTTSGVFETQRVSMAIHTVYLLDENGTLITLASEDSSVYDLLELRDGSAIRLISEAEIPEGRYVGFAVAIAADSAYVQAEDGARYAIQTSPIVFSDTDFEVSRNELSQRESRSFSVNLDIRLSFSDQSETYGTYAFQPKLNVVDLDTSASLGGVISNELALSDECLDGRSGPGGAAVYIFSGADVEPYDDYSGAQPGPLATAALQWNALTGTATYAFSQLAPGPYTISLTCYAYADDPLVYQALPFLATTTLSLAASQAAEANID
jgi:hypothetical protein